MSNNKKAISSRKTLSYVAPTIQNGEIIVRSTLATSQNGSRRWRATAVGYFLGKRPYFHHLKEYAKSVWLALREVTATANGFFFFQFKTIIDMEEVIEGGPWLFQGQPIVLQKWKSGMVMRKLKHTQVPVWICLCHLLVELWTEEGLSTIASGVGKPLYPDAITRACTRLDFARVCVMLDISSKLPKHIIIMAPDEDGGESPSRVDVEYEWLPLKCTGCRTLGHSVKDCTVNKSAKSAKPPVSVYVPKVGPSQTVDPGVMASTSGCRDSQTEDHAIVANVAGPSRKDRGKAIITYNAFDALQLIDDADKAPGGPKECSPTLQFLDFLEMRVQLNNVPRIQSFLLPHWNWFVDYTTVENRIWIAWDENFIDVKVLDLGPQFIHARVTTRPSHEPILMTIIYGANELAERRNLWGSLESLAPLCVDTSWIVWGFQCGHGSQ
ncbi:UNVERIFIED_CONTAM: hypothetical protein Sindi_2460100 [Sesamum indicum]